MDTAIQVYGENTALPGQSVVKICRLCCSENQADLSLLFPEGTTFKSNKLLLKKIFECTTVQIVNEGDDQNAMICQACIAKIDDFYSYREQCKTNDDRIRHRLHIVPEITIKQEKDLQLEINLPEPITACEDGFHQEESSQPRPSSHSTTTATNEFHGGPEHEVAGKDGEDSLLQPMGSKMHRSPPDLNTLHATDEITIKREIIVEDDEIYYNSEGEAVSVPAHSKQDQSHNRLAEAGSSKKSNYRIIMTSNNRERLVYQGYLYCRHFSRRDGSVHWRCRLGGCQAAVNLNADDTITHANSNKHSHAPNAPFEGDWEEPSLSVPHKPEGEEEDTSLVESFAEPFGEEEMNLDDSSQNCSELISVGEETLKIVPNKKKGATLVHLGFKYCKRYVKMDGSTFWKCRSNNNKCTAGVYVYPEAKVKYHGTHNHGKVLGDGQDIDVDSTVDEGMLQAYTIVEDVENDDDDDDEPEQDYNDDMAALLTPSVEVMMSDEQRLAGQDYEITTNVKGRECLIYEGHQYSKDRERYDGAMLWRCRRNYDKCRAVAIIYADGRIEKSGDHRHETDKRYLERQEQGNGSRMFRITKNQRGNDALVFEGHRFSKEWSRVDGSIIWRCSYRSGMCRVKVVLNAEAYIHRMGAEHEHDHEQTEAPVTEEYYDEDVEILDDPLITPVRNQQKLTLLPAVACPNFTIEQQTAGGYRIIKNRKGFEALVYDGYRYCKVRVRQDGSIKWLCKMNKKTCRAAVDLFTDGSIAKATEFDHNHERPNDMDTMEEDEEVEPTGHELTFPIDPEVFGSSQWYYVKNSKNGISMIHAGYRYTKKCDRVDGTSLWRCSASQRGCKAGVILFPNDTLAMVENAEHSHKPSENIKSTDYEPDSEEQDKSQPEVIDISEQDDAGNDSEMNMHSLLQTVLGGDDVAWMGGEGANEADNDQGNESVWHNSSTDRPYPRPKHGPPGFRIIKNRRNTDSLVHRGYRYCKIRDRVDGSILWTCQMNKKTCKASVNLAVDGRVEVINAGHNHEKTDRDDIGGSDSGGGADVSYEQNVSYDVSSDVDLTIDEIVEEEEPQQAPPPKHPDYYYSTNKSNNECLIYKGNRMCKRSGRPDGSTVWRCSMNGNTCMAAVQIHADGTPEENSVKHNHQPLADLPPEIERVAKPPPAQSLQPIIEPIKPTGYKRQGDSLEWDGFQYRKIKELPDGCIIWICHVDSCRVAVKMLPTNQLKMLSESEHNHTVSGQSLSQVTPSATSVKPLSSAPSSSDGRGRSYRLFKNQRGQMTLLYQGYRYSIRNRNQDGSSSWKCRSNSSCRAIIFLMQDDRIVQGNNNAEHNHGPNWESTKKLESVVPTRVNPLYDYLNIIPGGSNRPSPAPKTPDPTSSASNAAQAAAAPDAVNYGRNVVEHKGFYYRLIVRKKNGREYWRCVHFKNRSCRAALFCRDNGTIVTSSNGKEHNHKGGAEGKPLQSYSFSAANKPSSSMGLLEAARSSIQPSPPDEVQLTECDEERYIDHGEYVIAKNRKDQNTLIYKDRRYYLSYNRSDGSAVWRCAHRKRYKCYAYVRLRPDGRLLSTGEQDHSHTLKTEQNPPAAELKQVRNYKIVKNRVGNDILIHENHRFRLNYQRNDGTTHWRCVWARSNHCSAGVYLFANGILKNAANEAAIVHNHPPPSQVRKAVGVNATTEPKIEPPRAQSSSRGAASRTIPEDEGITDFKFSEEGSNKILNCRGYRYWYTWIRKDGSIYYRCAEVKKLQCPMGILLLSNGKLVRAGDQCHNHDPSREEGDDEFLGFPSEVHKQTPANPQPQEEIVEHYSPLVIPQGGDSDYKIAKTSRGESLIYQGYRYWAKNRLANGIVSLCCTRKKMKKCPAMLRLMTNGRVTDPLGFGHTHLPNVEGGGDITMQPVSVTVTPVVPKPAIIVKEPVMAKPSIPAGQLPALTFNEESDDDAEGGDESIIGSKRYTFMKSSTQRNFIVFEGYVYDFEHKQHDGCVFYRCKTSESCPATLMLLSNGRVLNLAESLHTHKKPDLSILRPVGRGSKEFKIVQNKNGSNILVHRGHRYTTPRSKTDGAGIWYCHTYVPEINRRCYVPIELLPNGRVAPVGDKQHSHTPPFKTKHESHDSKEGIPKAEHSNGANHSETKVANNRMLLHGGHRYNFANKRDDGAILWKCIEKTCNASMYRLTDGHIVKGPDHNHDRMEALDNSFKRKHSELENRHTNSSPIVTDGESSSTPEPTMAFAKRESTSAKGNPYIGKPIIYEGYRYVYYLSRRDGSEHWRCSRRIPMKCRGGLYKLTDGSLISSNDEGHTHPPDAPNMDESIPMPYTITETSQHSIDSADVEEEVPESSTADQSASFVDDEGSYDYELIDVKGKKRGMYLIHKGAMFVAGHTRRDRARYYRCRTFGCKVAMLLHRNGLLMRCNEHTHDCQNAIKTEDPEKEDGEDEEESNIKKQRLSDEEESLEPVDEEKELTGEDETAEGLEQGQDLMTNESTEVPLVEVKQEPTDAP